MTFARSLSNEEHLYNLIGILYDITINFTKRVLATSLHIARIRTIYSLHTQTVSPYLISSFYSLRFIQLFISLLDIFLTYLSKLRSFLMFTSKSNILSDLLSDTVSHQVYATLLASSKIITSTPKNANRVTHLSYYQISNIPHFNDYTDKLRYIYYHPSATVFLISRTLYSSMKLAYINSVSSFDVCIL